MNNQLKFYYLFYVKNKNGIYESKIQPQLRALQKKSYYLDYPQYIDKTKNEIDVYLGKNSKSKVVRKNRYQYSRTIRKQIERVFNLLKHNLFLLKLIPYINRQTFDMIYVRKYYFTYIDLIFYSLIRSRTKNIVLELPTYPYDGEIRNKIILNSERKIRIKLYKYIDKLVTFTEDKKIWGIDCININNGVDLDCLKPISKNIKGDVIVFTHVSSLLRQQAVDRFLRAMDKYNKNKNSDDKEIVFNIVGDGDCAEELKEYTNKLGLNKQVKFYGYLRGEALDKIYDVTNIAVGPLGVHRVEGLKAVQALKNREYTAKGLPFIISFSDPCFDDKEFVYHVSNDEEDIDLFPIIEWYEKNSFDPLVICKSAEDLSWDKQMSMVVDSIFEK